MVRRIRFVCVFKLVVLTNPPHADVNLEVLKTGCFKYFELGGDCIAGPVSLLSAYVTGYSLQSRQAFTLRVRRLKPSPASLFYHFFRVAFYSIYCLFATPVASRRAGQKPPVWQYPQLTVKSFQVFWTACVVLLPVLWSEGQM